MWFVHWLSARLTTAAWFSQISDHLQDRLQSISNADAHLVFSAWQSEHITPLLCELHWLRLPERITFRLHSGLPMSSWNNSILPRQEPSADIWCRWLLMSTLVCTLLTQPVVLSTTCLMLNDCAFQWPQHVHAIICQECTVADDIPSRTEDNFYGHHLTMIGWSWLYCTVQPLSARDYQLSALLSFLKFCTMLLQCIWQDSVTSVSTLLLTCCVQEDEEKPTPMWSCGPMGLVKLWSTTCCLLNIIHCCRIGRFNGSFPAMWHQFISNAKVRQSFLSIKSTTTLWTTAPYLDNTSKTTVLMPRRS